jgi:LPS-assembly protein
MRRFALLIAAAALLVPVRGADSKADLSADSTITYDDATGDLVAKPNARLSDQDFLLTADEIRYNEKTQIAVALGTVVLTRIGDRLLADRLTYNRTNRTFTATNLRTGRFPFYIEGPRAEGNQNEVVVHDATVTYAEAGRWQPTIKAKTLTYSPGHYLRLSGANVGVGHYLPLPISKLGEDLAHQGTQWHVTVDGGYRHTLGPYIDLGVHLPVVPGFTLGPDVGIYSFRGIMLGPTADYNITNGDDTMTGFLKSGYIYDQGRRLEDILDNPVPPNRAYAEWEHVQQINPELSFVGDITWETDSEVMRDFHAKEFVPVQEPDNFLETTYAGPDYLASVFARFQPDPFYPVQQRLPEVSFDLLPTAIGGGIYVRFDTSVAHLLEIPPVAGAHLESNRFDAFLGLSRPFTYKGIVEFTPVVGGRYTEYWDTYGAPNDGGTSRALTEVGFDADLKASGVFDYENPLWHIDGLRHLITPTLSYRYIPDADKNQDWIPQIDRSTFTTYLPVMELGDMRALDQLQAEDVLRVGLNNTVQTRDATYGSRDLLTFDLDEDFRFARAPGETDHSDVHAEFVATPARWLEIRVEDSVSGQHLSQRAMDSTITVREGDLWSAGFGIGYLSDSYGSFYLPGLGYEPIVGLDIYHLEVRDRLNEVYEAFARGDYDLKDHIFVDQFYGLRQKVSNTWIVEYALTFSNGPNNGQGHFGFNVSLNMTHF